MSKEAIVLIAGHMCDERVFGHQIGTLGNDHEVRVPSISSFDEVSRMASAVLDASPPEFALAGHSLGGIVAMEVYRQQPDRITRLALMSTNHRPDTELAAKSRQARMARVTRGDLLPVVEEELKPVYFPDEDLRQVHRQLIMDMAIDLGPEVFMRQSHALLRRPDQTLTLGAVSIPTVFIHGEHDELCTPERHREMHDLVAGSRIHAVPDAGHMITLEQPDTVTDMLVEWIRT